MRRTLEGLQNPGVRTASDKNFVDLEYADDIFLAVEEEEKAQREALEVVERFTYLGSCISSDCSMTDEVNARISKARVASKQCVPEP
ncbi:hypothetical protein CLF_111152 [Clonorchis sinensis]|uniref:Reverse transcriptase domain-containing protein n=1 Tax=Clonorchis sinensis TaxID=79923 RepID=G7YUF7_CLOSI|nr:hypothetical protein CLF_111152 [Clonorchis sinensis]